MAHEHTYAFGQCTECRVLQRDGEALQATRGTALHWSDDMTDQEVRHAVQHAVRLDPTCSLCAQAIKDRAWARYQRNLADAERSIR